jgi:hypothetical protein
MRIWDIHPGYLNRQSLLGEHRELHGIVSILTKSKKGYSKHPETLRWIKHGWALRQRHRLLAMEMALRGFSDHSPVMTRSNPGAWPDVYVDAPWAQFQILAKKYSRKDQGRISLPQTAQQLWSQHKYSVLARHLSLYRDMGRKASYKRSQQYTMDLAAELVDILHQEPTPGGIHNAVQHMWGYVSQYASYPGHKVESWSTKRLLRETQVLGMQHHIDYLMQSTALSELMAWLKGS